MPAVRPVPAFLPALAVGARHQSPLCSGAARRPPRRARSARAAAVRASVVLPGAEPTDQVLAAFAAAVRGEWVGYEGTFDAATGAVEPIPDVYIPEQFAEWNLVPHGFETNHSSIVRGDTLYRKLFRVLPTVSHFADHVDTEEDLATVALRSSRSAAETQQQQQQQQQDGVAGEVGAAAAAAAAAAPAAAAKTATTTNATTAGNAVFPDGSFILGKPAVPPRRESRLDKWPALALCLRDPRRGQRRAANLWLSIDFAARAFAKPVRVVLERWSCDHCDGADLEGSSGFVDGWPSGPPGCAADLKGEWAVHSRDGEEGDDDDSGNDAQAVLLRGDFDDADSALYLPEGIDVAVYESLDGGVVVRAGWLVDEDTRIVLRRSFSPDGVVLQSERQVERRIS